MMPPFSFLPGLSAGPPCGIGGPDPRDRRYQNNPHRNGSGDEQRVQTGLNG